MKKPVIFAGVGLLGLVIVGAIAWYLVSPLFIDDVVDEGFPVAAASSQDESASLAQVSQTSLDQIDAEIGDQLSFDIPTAEQLADMPEEDLAKMEAEIIDASADMPDKKMDDPMPDEVAADAPVAVVQGQFQGAGGSYQGSGSATIYQLPDGSHTLRFEDFMVTNGPDLHVLLTKHPAPTTRADLEDYIDLGQLKGNIGNQNYEIPADIDISEYQGIVIYCDPFHVIFSTATLG